MAADGNAWLRAAVGRTVTTTEPDAGSEPPEGKRRRPVTDAGATGDPPPASGGGPQVNETLREVVRSRKGV